ncbi:hypothetical protein CLV98_1044 [Dyadobacter jejuensis]|uniref:Uncharacterized protein n=1 Tax=Dyadobacter jejuensis TaxID=1082580 RepID=A0A316B6C7_9BACT|nr:hypothetical protein [Dyadobacter jejuensis]PWJ58147.1 hypothetical protein CLV98_1044 [Dyadobacter jejuensis]
MKEHNETGTVPAQCTGQEIVAQTTRSFESVEAAITMFELASHRLLDVNNWNKLTQQPLVDFQVTDAQGNPLSQSVEEGNCLSIDIPGPGTATGEGRDWVSVELVKEYVAPNVDSIGMMVRPMANPTNDDTAVAHFYSPESTSSFTITREGTRITAAIYDKNISLNKTSENVTDELRNRLVGMVGMAFYSKWEWQKLTDGLLS